MILASLTSSTRLKLRQVLFRMMREAGVISQDGQIQAALLSSQLKTMIEERHRRTLQCSRACRSMERSVKSVFNRKEQAEHLYRVVTSERFLKKQGLGNEVPFFICPFPAEFAVGLRTTAGTL